MSSEIRPLGEQNYTDGEDVSKWQTSTTWRDGDSKKEETRADSSSGSELAQLEDHADRHNQNADEAARATDEVMQDEERARHFKRATRKLDWAIIPALLLIWLANFVDRSNAGNARIAGLERDLGLEGNQFNIALAVFYITYIAVELPSNVVLKKLGGNIWLPTIVIGWGIITAFTGLTQNFAGFVAVRTLLGAAEGGLLGGISLYLSTLYPRFMMQQRIARFYAAAAIAGSFGGLLATGLTRLETGGIAGWRWLFIVEGIITVGIGIFGLCVLPNTIARTRYLNPQEREAFLTALAADTSATRTVVLQRQLEGEKSKGPLAPVGNDQYTDEEPFEWLEIRRGILDIQTWLTGVGYLCLCCSLYSLTLFLPTILLGIFPDADQARIQLLTVPPFVPAAFLVLIAAYFADKLKTRGPFILGFLPLAIVGYIILVTTDNLRAKYAAVFLICAGIYPSAPAILSLIANNSAGHYKRAASTAFQLMIANLAGFVATFIYDREKFGGEAAYVVPHGIVLGCLCLGWLCFAANVAYCYFENKARAEGRRDDNIAKYEELVRSGKTRAPIGDRHPAFRFSL